MTRSVYIVLFVIFVTIHSSVQLLECGPSEDEDNCPSDCYSDKCPTREHQNVGCTASSECGTPRCKCHFNTRRALNGTCIKTTDCPPFDCERPNEEYVACPPFCPSDDCRQSTPDGRCPIYGHIFIVLECEPACRCIKGYWRKEGECVPYEECPQHSTTLQILYGL
ncbi:alpha-tectorin [Helicoverpa armigera]|uniref:alpha-tectorin n=1 Tax=Helicoverpa armigera TaxID=29058 RepID=UPI003082B0AF